MTVYAVSENQQTVGAHPAGETQAQIIPFKMQEIQAKPRGESFKAPSCGNPASGSAGTNVLQRMIQESLEEIRAERGRRTPAVLKAASVGGGGANALNRMIEESLGGVEYIAINTDLQDLCYKSKAEIKLQIGEKITGGTGAGGIPAQGEQAALEDQSAIADVLKGADMVFITAGMGGGTGTGAAPIIARIAKELGALTVAVVTTPFEFEGPYKMELAQEGIRKLRAEVDTLIVIPNQYLFKIIDNTTSWNNAYLLADKVLCQAVQGISSIITEIGFNNVDFADVKTIMKGKGDALMGIGYGSGPNRAEEAVKNAIDNPLLEDSCINGATGVLVNIAAPMEITMVEINNIIKSIREKCDPKVHLIYGFCPDSTLKDDVKVTVIATGFSTTKREDVKLEPVKVNKNDTDFIEWDEYARMIERTKRPDYLPIEGLPYRGVVYEDDLDVPSVLRSHDFK